MGKCKTQSRTEVTRGWREEQWELLFNGYRVSVWDDGKFLEIDDGDGYTTLWMCRLAKMSI